MKIKNNIASNGMKKKIFGFIIGCTMILIPLLSFNVAQAKPIVPNCGKLEKVDQIDNTTGKVIVKDGVPQQTTLITKPCDFNYLMELVNNVIDFLLFVIATPLVAIILCYAGFIMLTSGGSSEKVTKAKHIIKSVVFGYIIALAAWLIINTILSSLGFSGPSFLKG